MAKYKLLYTEGFYRSLKPIPKKETVRIFRKTVALADDPRPVGSQKLSGQEHYRIRQGDYRIIYSIEDDRLVIIVVNVGHRSTVYKR